MVRNLIVVWLLVFSSWVSGMPSSDWYNHPAFYRITTDTALNGGWNSVNERELLVPSNQFLPPFYFQAIFPTILSLGTFETAESNNFAIENYKKLKKEKRISRRHDKFSRLTRAFLSLHPSSSKNINAWKRLFPEDRLQNLLGTIASLSVPLGVDKDYIDNFNSLGNNSEFNSQKEDTRIARAIIALNPKKGIFYYEMLKRDKGIVHCQQLKDKIILNAIWATFLDLSPEARGELNDIRYLGFHVPYLDSLWCESNRDVSRMSEAKRDLSEFPHSFS